VEKGWFQGHLKNPRAASSKPSNPKKVARRSAHEKKNKMGEGGTGAEQKEKSIRVMVKKKRGGE